MATERLVEDLLTLWRLLRNLSSPVRRAEMTPEQYWLLRLLNRSGPLNISELANELGIAISSATVSCKRLEKAGLLTRERQSDDERVVRVALTAKGLAQIDAWRQRKREVLTHWLSVLDAQEQKTLQSLIERVLEAADARAFEETNNNDSYR
jgi:MarR family transcriptional regulator, organic hydroperoxide resistance regulator